MNKNMKKITLLLVTLFATGTMLMAQGGPRRGHGNMDPKARAEYKTERMAKEYSLSDAQKKQVYEVNLEMAQKMTPPQKADTNRMGKKGSKDAKVRKACCEGCTSADSCKMAPKDMKGKRAGKGKPEGMANIPSKENREKMMADMKQSREAYDAKLKGIFTKEQYDAYTKKQAERQKRMDERQPKQQRSK